MSIQETVDRARKLRAGRINGAELRRLRKAAGNKCEACKYRPPHPSLERSVLHSHHVVPRSCGGTDSWSNLVVICANCHALVHGFWRVRRGEWPGPKNRDELLKQLRALLKGDTSAGISLHFPGSLGA